MRQPVSRITFDRRRGFLGVHLQEGALFVDAAWNEGADIAFSLLRDAVIAGGIAGTSGRELRIEAIDDDRRRGRLPNLRVCGTSATGSLSPRPFYCDGLPVLWPADLPIDAQLIGEAFRVEATGDTRVPPGGIWVDLLQDLAYEIYLRARVVTLDRLDDPFLDDLGLDAARGTFRKRVTGEVRIRKAGAPRPPVATNLRLSVDGSYLSDLNVLYRVELDSLTGSPGAPAAAVLWDPDAAATVARVVDSAAERARLVMVDSTEGFDAGFVRFEGQGIGPELYRVTKAPGLEGAAIRVTRHRCDRAEVSLATWQPSGPVEDDPPDQFTATLLVPAPVQVGDVLRDLPAVLELPWDEAKVVAVKAFDPDHNVVTLSLQKATPETASPRALSIADWRANAAAVASTDGSATAVLVAPPAIVEGDVVVALPPSLGAQTTTGPWVALSVTPRPAPATPGSAAPAASAPPSRPLVAIRLGPAGLRQRLLTLDTGRTATLRAPARQFDTALTVDDRLDWAVGTRVSILRKVAAGAAVDASTVAAREDRTIVRIEHTAGGLAAGERRRARDVATRTMLVRLDQPLSYDHAAGETEVTPERLIRVRRFAGHECRLGIDRIDPAQDGAASIANFSAGLPLPGGLSLHLTLENTDEPPRLERGDGWHFAARSDGWVETRLFAPVEDDPASEVPLARLTVKGSHYELVDLRPVPAAVAVDDELARITGAAHAILGALGDDPAAYLVDQIARLSSQARPQPGLVRRLRELAETRRTKLFTSPACRPWLEQLGRAVFGIGAGAEPTRGQLAAIGFALGGLAFAVSSEHAHHGPAPSPSPLPPPPTSGAGRTLPGIVAQAEPKQGLLDKADAMLAKIEDELKAAKPSAKADQPRAARPTPKKP